MGFNDLMKLDIQKFASGTISGGNYNNIYSYYMTWSSTSNGPEANSSNVTLRWIYKKNASDPYGAYNNSDSTKVTLTINGSSNTQVAHFDLRNAAVGSTQTIATYTLNNVPHNADGSKSISVSGSHTTGTSWGTKSIGSTSITLDKIPRYTTTTTWAVASKTETSITLNWKTADICSSIRYGTSTSSYTTKSVNAKSGSVTISGLSANTDYTLYFMPCRKDSGLWGNGAANTWKSLTGQKTYSYPYVITAPNFIIGNSAAISLYNPLSRSISVAIKYGSTTIRTLSTSSTSVTYNSSSDSSTWYSKIPNNSSGTYTATATWSEHTTASKSGTFSVDAINDAPDFNLFEWEDTNPTTLALTGSSDIVILDSTNNKGFSNVQATISLANKATAKNSSTMSKYTFECGSATPVNIPYSNSASVSGTINNAPSSTYKVSAIDSRGLSKAVTLSAINVVNYTSLAKGSASIARAGQVSEQVTLNIAGKMWVGNFGVQNNQITNVTYEYKTGTGSYVTGITTITPTVDQNGNFSFTGLIKGDTNDGFDIDNVYSIKVTVYDKLSSVTYTLTLPSGKPHLAWYNTGLSIMGEYDENRDDALQVNGNTNIKGNIYKNGTNIFNIIYPVGSTFISSTNTNPNTTLGFGTWSLIDKQFTTTYGSTISNYWTDSSNAECTSLYMIRGGHTIHLGLQLTTKTAIADTSVKLGTFDFDELGITNTIFTRRPMGFSDDGDAIMGCQLVYNTGVLNSIDIYPHGTLASGSSVTINIDLITARANMLDAKCNQFVWRRTA